MKLLKPTHYKVSMTSWTTLGQRQEQSTCGAFAPSFLFLSLFPTSFLVRYYYFQFFEAFWNVPFINVTGGSVAPKEKERIKRPINSIDWNWHLVWYAHVTGVRKKETKLTRRKRRNEKLLFASMARVFPFWLLHTAWCTKIRKSHTRIFFCSTSLIPITTQHTFCAASSMGRDQFLFVALGLIHCY